MANASTKYRIAINGYGRIGQCVLRALVERQHPELEVVAINELSDLATITYLTRYDTTHGRFPGEVDNDGSALLVNCLLYTSPSPRDKRQSRMPSSA